MDKTTVLSVLEEVRRHADLLPEQVRKRAEEAEAALGAYSADRFERLTDHVVTGPAEREQNAELDPDLQVNRLYEALNAYVEEHRGSALPPQLLSALQRLRGQVDAYERDFP